MIRSYYYEVGQILHGLKTGKRREGSWNRKEASVGACTA